MSSRYAIIGDEVWDLDIEEPVERLSDTDASDEACLNEFLAQALLVGMMCGGKGCDCEHVDNLCCSRCCPCQECVNDRDNDA